MNVKSGATLAPVATRAPRPVPRIRVGIAMVLSFLAAVHVALSQIDHVLSQVVSGGKSWSPTQLSSLGTIFHPEVASRGWRFFHAEAPDIARHADTWLAWYCVVDLLLILGYVVLAYAVVLLANSRLRFWGGLLVIAGGCADIGEDVLILLSTHYLLIVVLTIVKWACLLLGALLLLLSVRRGIRPMLGHVLHALYTHRYTVLTVLPLAVLGLASGTDILEQVPDIQRTWLDQRWWDIPAAAGVLTLVGVTMLYVGRQRTDHLWLRTCGDWTGPDHPHADDEHCPAHRRQDRATVPLLHVWFLGPVVLGALAVVALVTGGAVAVVPLAVFCSVPLAIGVSSWLLRRRHSGPPERPIRHAVSVRRYDVTAVVGDILVGLLTLVAGLGSIRAFTALALIDPHVGNFVMLGIGTVGVLAGWPLHAWLLSRLARRSDLLIDDLAERRSGEVAGLTWGERSLSALTPGVDVVALDDQGRSVARTGIWDSLKDQRWNWAVLTVSLLLLLATASLPVKLAEGLGVIGTFELALGCLSVVVAATVILLQKGGAPEVFWLVGIPYAPVTALLVVSALVAGTRSTGVHDIRDYDQALGHSEVTAKARPTLRGLFQQWLADDEGCGLPATGLPVTVRPMLLYAAEGGGVRAAYWTTKAVDRIGAPRTTTGGEPVADICRSAFLSSGASGGSVGLTIASVSGLGQATQAVKQISGPEALAAATDGLVLRDTLYAATGVPLPSFFGPAKPDWADRGTLIEQSWEDSIPALRTTPFLRAAPDWTWTPPGALVINSTSTTTACRTLVSQVQVASSPGVCTTGAEQPQAGALTAANSTDLVSCTGQLRSTTAALLTARFPYVTPSGVVGCGHDKRLQIVDGGYAENFGIGTLVDLAPQLMDLVRDHNTCVLRRLAADPCSDDSALDEHGPATLVVPMLVYLDNGTGTDLAQQPGGLDLEVLVPPVTLLAAKKELYEARSQLARAGRLLGTDELWDQSVTGSDTATTAVDAVRKSPVAIVFQATRPQVAGPLGWVLSEASMRAMDNSICDLERGQDIGDALNPDSKKGSDPLLEHSLDDVEEMLPGTPSVCVKGTT